MPDLRLGLIGCGGIAKTHVQGWRAVPGATVTACADLTLDRARAFADEHGIAGAYGDFHAMLERERLDAVSVCTWPGTHAEATVAAAEAGVRGILCEKPMARSLGEHDAMMAAADAAGAKLAVGFHHRFLPANLAIRRMLADGAIGTPVAFTLRIHAGLSNNGAHLIDRTRGWLGDEPAAWAMAQVERKTNRHERREPTEDRCAAIVAFAGGARMVLETDTPGSDQNPDAYLVGTDGLLRLAGHRKLFHLRADGWQEVDLPPAESQYAELAAWMDGGPEHRNAAANSRATTELLMALYESVRTRGLVELPLANPDNPLRQLIAEGRLPLEREEAYDIRP